MEPSTKLKKQPRKEESSAAEEGRSNQEKSRREGGTWEEDWTLSWPSAFGEEGAFEEEGAGHSKQKEPHGQSLKAREERAVKVGVT